MFGPFLTSKLHLYKQAVFSGKLKGMERQE